jgi:hypothetical protein
MSRRKTAEATAEAPITEAGPDVFDPQIEARQQEEAARQAAQVVESVAQAHTMPQENPPAGNGKSHAAGVERKKYTPPADPFGFENKKGTHNRVQLLKSEEHGAWVIRFAHNPNEDKGPNGEEYSKTNQHPVLKMLKDEGYKWGFDSKGKGGWGKAFSGDPYGTDHMEARRVLQEAAEMIGAPKQDRGPIPD